MPYYNEIVHLPFFFHDPRTARKAESCRRLAQTIDICPTLLEYFGAAIPESVQGKPLSELVREDSLPPAEQERRYVLFGLHGGHINITDGDYVYMRAPIKSENTPLFEYTLMPARTHERISVKYFQEVELQEAFSFTKGCRTLKLDLSGDNDPNLNVFRFGSRLYDLKTDPRQRTLLDQPALELAMIREMAKLMATNDAPPEQYQRVGIPESGIMTELELLEQRILCQQQILENPLPGFGWSREASSQFKTMLTILGGNDETRLAEEFERYAKAHQLTDIFPEHIYEFARIQVPAEDYAKVLFFLKQSERFD